MLFHITQTQLKQFEERTREAKWIWEITLKTLPAKERNALHNLIFKVNKKVQQRRQM